MDSSGRCRAVAVAVAVLAGLALTLALSACGGEGRVAASASPSPTRACRDGDHPIVSEVLLGSWVARLRGGLKGAYAGGRSATGFRAAPASVILALRRWLATVDPGRFNGASRVRFIWAFTLPREPDGHTSTPTRQYVDVYFWADGKDMAAAGSMAPGFNDQYVRLSRSTRTGPWHVDGLYEP